MEENNRQNIPTFCRNQCGFYGSPSFDYFCSKCHRSCAVQREDAQVIDRMSADIKPEVKTPELPQKTSRPASSPQSESPKPKNDQPAVTVTTDDNFENESATSPPPDLSTSVNDPLDEPEADAEVAAAGLPETLLPNLKDDDCKPGSPASSCSSTGETSKKRPICAVCRKRVGLTGFKCRCGGLFCSTHRYSDVHECSFDYRVSGQEEIRRSNPQVVCEKVQKI